MMTLVNILEFCELGIQKEYAMMAEVEKLRQLWRVFEKEEVKGESLLNNMSTLKNAKN